MAEQLIGLSIKTLFGGDHNHPDIAKFLEGFSNVIYSGDGKKAQAIQWLNVEASFPIQALVGMPEDELTRPQRKFTEAWCSLFLGRPLDESAGIWTHEPGWSPVNPSRKDGPLAQCVLDTEWMLSFGIARSVWENQILHAPGAIASNQRGADSASRTLRHYLMLSVFGFAEPKEFFTFQA
jgi:hypothetical protein